MPSVTCPGCEKKYNLPATAAGQVANCKCGKKFRVGGAPADAKPTPTVTSASAAKHKPVAPQPAARAVAPVAVSAAVAKSAPTVAKASVAKDDFWDDALSEPVKAAPVAAPIAPMDASRTSMPDRRRRPEDEVRQQKKKKKVVWGADWAKVGGGLTTCLVAGGITAALLFTTGRLFLWPAGIAVVGLFTALSGLMGEEGVW